MLHQEVYPYLLSITRQSGVAMSGWARLYKEVLP
jgi:hypothetical protein